MEPELDNDGDVIMNVPCDDARAAKSDAIDRARSPARGGVEVSR